MHFDACKQDSVFDRYPKDFVALLNPVPSAFGDAHIQSVHLRCNNATLTDPDLHAREKLTAAFLGRIQLAHGVRVDFDGNAYVPALTSSCKLEG